MSLKTRTVIYSIRLGNTRTAAELYQVMFIQENCFELSV